jgi:hypothetical protein
MDQVIEMLRSARRIMMFKSSFSLALTWWYLVGDRHFSLVRQTGPLSGVQPCQSCLVQQCCPRPMEFIQCRTAKIDKVASSGTRFFQGRLTSDLNSERLNTSKNALSKIFLCSLSLDNFWDQIFYI